MGEKNAQRSTPNVQRRMIQAVVRAVGYRFYLQLITDFWGQILVRFIAA